MPLDTTIRTTVDEALATLEALGSQEAIARYLQLKGIKGVCNAPSMCAIAVYLQQETGLAVGVGREQAYTYADDDDIEASLEFKLPAVVQDFIWTFDDGLFPALLDDADKAIV